MLIAILPSGLYGRVMFLTPTPCQPISHAAHHVRDAQRSCRERGDPGQERAPHIMFSTSNVPVMNEVLQARGWQRDTASHEGRSRFASHVPSFDLRCYWS